MSESDQATGLAVVLTRGSEGLGIDLTFFDDGVCCIRYIDANGIVGRDGRIEVGDELVAVNGAIVSDEADAIETIRNGGETVELSLLRRPAHQRRFRSRSPQTRGASVPGPMPEQQSVKESHSSPEPQSSSEPQSLPEYRSVEQQRREGDASLPESADAEAERRHIWIKVHFSIAICVLSYCVDGATPILATCQVV